jgi:hypothetical protein
MTPHRRASRYVGLRWNQFGTSRRPLGETSGRLWEECSQRRHRAVRFSRSASAAAFLGTLAWGVQCEPGDLSGLGGSDPPAPVERGGLAQVFDLAQISPPPLDDAPGDGRVSGSPSSAGSWRSNSSARMLSAGSCRCVVLSSESLLVKSAPVEELVFRLAVGPQLVHEPLTVPQPVQHAPRERKLIGVLEVLPHRVGLLESSALPARKARAP